MPQSTTLLPKTTSDFSSIVLAAVASLGLHYKFRSRQPVRFDIPTSTRPFAHRFDMTTSPSSFSRPAFSVWWFAGKQWNAPTCCCVTWEIDEYGGRKRMHTWRCLTTHVSTNRTVPYVGSRYWHLIDTSRWTPYNPYPVCQSTRRNC